MSETQRIPTLDGWRGIAILMVLLSHAGLVPWGLHGVTIFFVLSGYLITSLLLTEQRRNGTISLREFYIRRTRRLMPAAIVYLGVIVLASRASGLPELAPWNLILGCLAFFRNFQDPLAHHGLTQHFWSLSVEEQFYILWPATLLLLGDARAKWFAAGTTIALASYRLVHWPQLASGQTNATFATQYRADALLLGCLLALYLPILTRHLSGWMIVPMMAALAACVLRFTLLIPAFESAVIALCIALTSQFPQHPLSRALQWQPLAYLGSISYSVYLWQQPLIPKILLHRSSWPLVTPLVFCLALLSYYVVERPLRRTSPGAAIPPNPIESIDSEPWRERGAGVG